MRARPELLGRPRKLEPADLVTVGEAADLAGIAHFALRHAIREGRLARRAGTRHGRVIDCVRFSELADAFPDVRGAALATPRPEACQAAAVRHARGRTGPHASTTTREVPPEVRRELQLLQDRVQVIRREDRRLQEELAAARGEVRELRAGFEVEDGRVELARLDLAEVREELARLQAERTRARGIWLGIAAVLLVALGAAWVAGWSWTSGEVEAAGPTDSVARAADVIHAASPIAAGGAAAEVARRAAPASRLNFDVPKIETVEVPDSPVAETPAPEPEPVEQHADGVVDGGASGTKPPEPEPADAPGPGEPRSAPVAVARSGAEPCLYSESTRPGEALRDVLGPCLGPWMPDERLTAGTHRIEGSAYCRQHRFFVSTLGGSIERAHAVADYARKEGLWPPLVRMRIDRAAARFLDGEIGPWIESGFEGGSPRGHRIEALEDHDDGYSVESWVRHADPSGEVVTRGVRVRVVLRDGLEGDLLLGVEWSDAR